MKIIKFSSKDCGTCKLIAPMVKRVCEAHNIELEEIDVDEQPDMIDEYEIQSLPTLVKLIDGSTVYSKTGLIS